MTIYCISCTLRVSETGRHGSHAPVYLLLFKADQINYVIIIIHTLHWTAIYGLYFRENVVLLHIVTMQKAIRTEKPKKESLEKTRFHYLASLLQENNKFVQVFFILLLAHKFTRACKYTVISWIRYTQVIFRDQNDCCFSLRSGFPFEESSAWVFRSSSDSFLIPWPRVDWAWLVFLPFQMLMAF